MRKVLIIGGAGTVGIAFIKAFYHQYQFYHVSRDEKNAAQLKALFPNVQTRIGSIENYSELLQLFLSIKPDIVIHAAAQKRVDVCEKTPSSAIRTNVMGSLNVIQASLAANIPITIALSSDKACSKSSVYGCTKYLMERLFLEADNEKNRFLCCRLSNVAGSVGSVIPFWMNLIADNKPLKITDANMNRFMYSPADTAQLIQKAIALADHKNSGCVLLKKIKSLNLLALAQYLSDKIEITGKRPGETLDETLVNLDEIPFTYVDDEYILIRKIENPTIENRISAEINTQTADKMMVADIAKLIASVHEAHQVLL